MHVVKPTHAKKGGKSHAKKKLSDYERQKERAVGAVMANVAQSAKNIEMNAVTHVIEKHIGRKLTFEDVPKIERLATETGYVLVYDGIKLGEIERFMHEDSKAENNYKVTFTPYE